MLKSSLSSLSYTPSHQGNVKEMTLATVESSAFFLRDDHSGTEIIIFGDIEPDSISLEPRNKKVWEIAAPKVANGSLRAIFVECSFTDSVEDNYLYGHLCPRHLIAELEVLAAEVLTATKLKFGDMTTRKRKHAAAAEAAASAISDEPTSPKTANPQSRTRTRRRVSSPSRAKRRTRRHSGARDKPPASPADGARHDTGHPTTPPASGSPMDDDYGDDDGDGDGDTPETSSLGETLRRTRSGSGQKPLSGLRVYIIHVKDSLTDGTPPREVILEELRAHNEDAALGCEFFAPLSGEEVFI